MKLMLNVLKLGIYKFLKKLTPGITRVQIFKYNL